MITKSLFIDPRSGRL